MEDIKKPNGESAKPAIDAQLIILHDEKGNYYFNFPKSKTITMRMLLTAIENAAKLPEDQPLIIPGINVGGRPTHRVS